MAADKAKAKFQLRTTFLCKLCQTICAFEAFFEVVESSCFLAALGTAIILIYMALVLDCDKRTQAAVLIALLGVFFAGEVAGAFTGKRHQLAVRIKACRI